MSLSRTKILLLGLAVLLFFGVLLARLVYLQGFKSSSYQRISNRYSFKENNVLAPRGTIKDRKGNVLANTTPSFNLYQKGELIKQKLSLEEATQIGIKKNLAAANEEHSESNPYSDYANIEVKAQALREYLYPTLFTHVLGYVRYDGTEWKGVQGLEKYYDEMLRGQDGKQQYLVDALGRNVNSPQLDIPSHELLQAAIPGQDLDLTLDLDLQRSAAEALKGKTGAVVMLSIPEGEVLALYSSPALDTNLMMRGMTKEEWDKINLDASKPLLNRTIQSAYPPGSTFKIVTALAALMEHKVKADEKITCPGYTMLGGRKFGCWNPKGHGPVNLFQALMMSCDVYFYELGERIGASTLANYAKKFGLGEKTGVDLDFERSGLVPDPEWKLQNRKEDWNAGDTLSMAIGQGANLVTPLQNAVMMATVAAQGREIHPHLLKSSQTEKSKSASLMISDEAYHDVMNSLNAVVQDAGGTAHKIALPTLKFGGKTGTAQVVNYDVHGRKAKSRATEDHAWFVAYAPSQNPQVAISVIVEHGGHGGSAAAPVAAAVLKKYSELNNKTPKE